MALADAVCVAAVAASLALGSTAAVSRASQPHPDDAVQSAGEMERQRGRRELDRETAA